MSAQVRWKPEEDERLRALAKAGKSVNEIANEMGRSRGSVRQRAEVLCVNIAKVARHLR
jgi:predicted transcriptional regulator